MEQIMQSTNIKLCVNVENTGCNFSGAESQAFELIKKKIPSGGIAHAVFDCIADTFSKMLKNASVNTGINDLIIFGGVMQNEYIKTQIMLNLNDKNIIFAKRGFSCDNAAGLAWFAMRNSESGIRN